MEKDIGKTMEEEMITKALPPVKDFLSSGCTILDLALANKLPGGFPCGRISQIFGEESTAKTILLAEALGSAQRQGGEAWFEDIEGTFDFARAEELHGLKIGIDDENHYRRAGTIEEFFDKHLLDIVKDRDESSPLGVVGVDSLTALESVAESEADLTGIGYGTTRARQFSAAFRKYIKLLSNTNLSLLFVDQSRTDITSRYPKQTTSGGRALAFYASIRVQLFQRGAIENKKKKPIGVVVKFVVVKSKVSPPLKSGNIFVLFDYGIDDIRTNLEWLRENKLLAESGPWIQLPFFEQKCQGIDAAVEKIEKEGKEQALVGIVLEAWKSVYEQPERKKRIRS